MTRQQMEEQVIRWLGLQDVSGYSETDMVRDQLYYGTLDMLSRTRCVVRCVHLRLLPDTPIYILDHSILALVEVDYGARRRRREETAKGFTLIRSDILEVKPTPSEESELDVWAVMRPQKMGADTDSPSFEQFGAIPDEFQDAIVTYALWKMSDYADDATAQQGERYRILYEGQDGNGGRLSQIRMLTNKRGTARAPRSKVSGLTPVRSSSAWIG